MYNQQQSFHAELNKTQTELSNVKEINKQLSDRTAELSTQYDRLYAEKNGTKNQDLLSASKKLFEAVYNYDTENKKQSVYHRKQKASEFADNNALDSLFPKDAETIVPSVTTVSTLDNDPECYVMSSDSRDVKALVVVKNTLTIAGGEDMSDSFIYKVTFDASKNQFTEIISLGNIKL